MTSSVVGLRRSSKALPKAKLAPKNIMVTAWWSGADLIHYSFLNPGETFTSEKYAQQIEEMLQKLQYVQLALVNRMSLILLHDNACHMSHNWHFKRWTNRAAKFCFTHHIHLISLQLTTTLQASQQLFAGKILPQPAGGRKCFPRVHWILKHKFLHYRNNQTYFLLAKMCWL